ncbi:ABC transporter substrate-binding protein [Marinobacter pelagius]|uniref:MlaC/ttg2D family ABC transporter substrate-binding protein n=1 Tax=Marinobacter sp. C7 TaxID=2951363 RepID=UPI001EF09E98|nr:ABC transporter substrate-binding protein [Marinobacter sp. C7]MCG7199076.1 ABC transporter substrate-binding protein [Marinobacter sp. C7]
MVALTQRLFLALVLMAAAAVQAQAGQAEELREYVDVNTQKLVERLNEERGLYEKDPEAFYQSMNEALTDFVDFRRIAARVMGRYARQTTPEQRDEFVEKFKRSLFDSYAKALVDAEDFQIRVREATILPRDENRASVDLEVISSSGNRYPVVYSMYRNGEGQWLMENVIVEGVNIGLAFRDRFSQEMEQNRGQIQVVIDGWTDTAKTVDLGGEEDQS